MTEDGQITRSGPAGPPQVLQPAREKWARPPGSAPPVLSPGLRPPKGPTLTVEPTPPAASGAEAGPRLAVRAFDRRGLLSVGIGLALGIAAVTVPVLKFVFSYLTIAIHEMGHTVFGWLFGYPSVPAFDFHYGGGVSYHQDRSIPVLVGLYCFLAAAGWLHRRNRLTLGVLAGFVGVHALVAYTDTHRVVILFMGHGFEILLAGVFLYRAMSGSGVLKGIERPLYAFCGFFILICDAAFAYGLATNRGRQVLYEAAKGGGHWMDFSRIAEQHLHVELTSVATFFGLCCLAVPLLSFLAFRYQNHVHAALERISRRA